MPELKDIALKVDGLNKDFLLPHEQKNSIKERVLHPRKSGTEHMHALRDINFEVKRGEFFGIVGRNGSGKSTLLKIIGGIYQPTKGSVQVNGTLTPFIELGIGFSPNLTGRENVFLNGAILGLTRKEMKKLYPEIVAFAELEKFMDQKLKNYSSGMQVRLAFSIAIQAHNDILLIDEVLAVGDANFQKKCAQVFKDVKKSGKTVIFVTHDMGAIQEYCDRAMMIQDSRIVSIGKPRDIALRYEIANANIATSEGLEQMTRSKNPKIKLNQLKIRSESKQTTNFSFDEDIIADIDFTVNDPVQAQLNLYFVRPDGHYVAGINTTADLPEFIPKKGKHSVSCVIKSGQLAKGDYQVGVGVYTYPEPAQMIDVIDQSYGTETPIVSILEKSLSRNGDFNIEGHWTK